jgi:hypothetical protein
MRVFRRRSRSAASEVDAVRPDDGVSPAGAVHVQILFRRVNERAREVVWAPDGEPCMFVCECRRADCGETLELTLREYETLRAHGDRFAVLPGHETPSQESVVDAKGGYLVVEKLGESRAIALWNDPRR